MTEFGSSMEKGYACKESGIITHGRRQVKVGTLLLSNDENNVIFENVLNYFLVLKLQVWNKGGTFWD